MEQLCLIRFSDPICLIIYGQIDFINGGMAMDGLTTLSTQPRHMVT